MNIDPYNESVFSVATLLYSRLRKVNSRVIDVYYFMQDQRYAEHIMDCALETGDKELVSYVARLRVALGMDDHKAKAQDQAEQGRKTEEEPDSYALFSIL